MIPTTVFDKAHGVMIDKGVPNVMQSAYREMDGEEYGGPLAFIAHRIQRSLNAAVGTRPQAATLSQRKFRIFTTIKGRTEGKRTFAGRRDHATQRRSVLYE